MLFRIPVTSCKPLWAYFGAFRQYLNQHVNMTGAVFYIPALAGSQLDQPRP